MDTLLSDSEVISAITQYQLEIDWPEPSKITAGEKFSISVFPAALSVATRLTETFIIVSEENFDEEKRHAFRRVVTKVVEKYK
jgi:hypothetical protein